MKTDDESFRFAHPHDIPARVYVRGISRNSHISPDNRFRYDSQVSPAGKHKNRKRVYFSCCSGYYQSGSESKHHIIVIQYKRRVEKNAVWKLTWTPTCVLFVFALVSRSDLRNFHLKNNDG